MPELQDRTATHFEQFADGLSTLLSDLQCLENRLYSLTGRINAPCDAAQDEPTCDEAPKTPEGLYWQFRNTMQDIVGVRDAIERHISKLEQSI